MKLSPNSYDPNSSIFMNVNYDPANPSEPLVKPPTKEELLYLKPKQHKRIKEFTFDCLLCHEQVNKYTVIGVNEHFEKHHAFEYSVAKMNYG